MPPVQEMSYQKDRAVFSYVAPCFNFIKTILKWYDRGGATIEGPSPEIGFPETIRGEMCILEIHILQSGATKDNSVEARIAEIGVENLGVVKIGFMQGCIAKVS